MVKGKVHHLDSSILGHTKSGSFSLNDDIEMSKWGLKYRILFSTNKSLDERESILFDSLEEMITHIRNKRKKKLLLKEFL